MKTKPVASSPLEIRSVTDFVRTIQELKRLEEDKGNEADLLFRGQPCDKKLLPRLGRLRLRGQLGNIERLMIEEFKRTLLPLTEFRPENDWDVLALAQHHGLPTRLLDWTFSGLAALWFAVRESYPAIIQPNEGIGVVWVFSASVEDYRLDVDKKSPFENSVTKIFRPKIISRRISSQSGVFTVHKIVNENAFVALETNKTYKSKVRKIVVPARAFPSIWKDLNIHNINAASLFPDLDGLSKYLEWRYSYASDELDQSGHPVAASSHIPGIAR